MTFWKWSTDPATNGSADSTCPWPEGMSPSQVNDSARGNMAALAKYRDDVAGKLVTGGTSSAYTVTSNQGFDSLSHLDGAMIAFVPHADCSAAPTLNVDGLGTKPLRGLSGLDLLPGVLQAGTPYVAFYNNTSGEFVLHSYYVSPGEIPIGGGLEYWGSTVPSDNFAFPCGQAISRTDYPVCFSRLGTTYGSGDGTTTFNLPDKRGRVSAGKDDMGGTSAGRLTPPASGGVADSTVLGSTGGTLSHTLTTDQMPSHYHANTLHDPGHAHNIPLYPADSNGASGGGNTRVVSGLQSTSLNGTGITITNANAGGGGAHNNVQPTIICNYLIRIK